MDTPSPPPPLQNLRPPPPERTFQNDAVISSNPTLEIATTSAMSTATDGPKATTIRKRRKKEKSKHFPDPHSLSSASSSSSPTASFSYSSAQKRGFRLLGRRRNPKVFSGPDLLKPKDVEALALPLGMSIAAVVAQVLERKGATEEKILLDHLSQICASAVKESLVNVFGDKFDCFGENFEKSFRSTLRTLRLISKSAKANGGENRRAEFSSEVTFSFNRSENCARDIEECWSESLPQALSREERPSTHEDIEETTRTADFRNQQLILHDRQIMQQLAVISPVQSSSALDSANNQAILTTFKKSVQEQKRSNDLKTFELGLTLKRMGQKEREMTLKSDANFLERCKLSFGFSKASFKVGKFKTQLEDTRHAELLRKCIDCLVAGLFIMLGCLGYGVFIYSHKRISEATSSCTPMESRSWWIPKPMASFNSGLQILKCQFQVLTRMLAGGIMVFVITYLLLQRSAASNQTLPVTFILLLLGVVCGFAGKLCIDTLGGSGICWLFFWEFLCLIHLFSNLWTSVLFVVLHGPVTASEKTRSDPVVPYWLRRCLFYTSTFLFLPVSCGFLPFASLGEWTNHFASLIMDPLLIEDGVWSWLLGRH